MRSDLPERLERSARRQFGALSLLKVESTVCFQRKRRRERAVTRERHDLPFRLERSAKSALTELENCITHFKLLQSVIWLKA
ncbi:hypothetical protein ACMZ7W_02260 [Gardnerella vaginalis]|uniref:hypothetical protein n=1 Tax=Gardnerella vaginalis TaxID=2702 RepID=UPI0039EE91F4